MFGVHNHKTGSVEGTGAAITISVGFVPTRVELFNIDGDCFGQWIDPMPAASVVKTVTSGAGTTDISYATSNGVTTTADGFTIGADSDLNVSAETIIWVATAI